MSPQLEEVVSHVRLDVEQFFPDAGELRFQQVARGDARDDTPGVRPLRGGKRGAVELPVQRQRQLVQQHERRRHHVFG
jgi:hypothetical protein